MLHYAIGKVRRDDGAIYILTQEGEAGCVVFGPYCVLSPGSYEVEFRIHPTEMTNDICCVVDVLRRGRTIAAEKDFTCSELIHRNGRVSIRFEVIERDTYEFRVLSTGRSALKVRYQRPVRTLPPPDQPNANDGA
ncbi:hypothetical protein [Lichenihabitans psoromatis]|uniref:hypothetical protein n=1 Tax=Lichenihabitans psoromatis TaxID=2528642 RepID=UPI0010359A0A|nr:hypothetical protein [Lichenihabitans psoromatis]